MTLDDDALKRLFDDPAAAPPRAARGCPDDEAFRRAADGEANAAEREALADHLVGCRDCAAEFRCALELLPLIGEAASLLDRPAPPAHAEAARFRRFVTPFLLAASVLLGAGLYLTLPRSRVPSVERGGAPRLAARVPGDGALLPEAPRRLAWTPIAGATGYRVALYDEESHPLWKSGPLTETEVAVPAEISGRLERQRPYYWRITVREGVEEETSPLFEFRIGP